MKNLIPFVAVVKATSKQLIMKRMSMAILYAELVVPGMQLPVKSSSIWPKHSHIPLIGKVLPFTPLFAVQEVQSV